MTKAVSARTGYSLTVKVKAPEGGADQVTKEDKVIDAVRNCIDTPKCKNCPWETCEEDHESRKIPLDLLKEVYTMIQRHRGEEAEIEGGGHMVFFVCGECHTALATADRYCRQCGRKITWV